jgi:ABC-2 type transport system ATP-binding protein
MIRLEGLTKRFDEITAVDDVSVEIDRGCVTGLLGPNGAGKSTLMRLLLGLDHPTSGRALVSGRAYREIPRPLCIVGAHLDGRAVHPGRNARNHLLGLARANAIPASRVDHVLGMVGLADVCRRRTRTYSLGMAQRLGLAAALLGDPEFLLLDEPVNGLDTDGVRWVRNLLRDLAAEGRTVLVSSHLLAEMQHTADRVIVLGRGRLLAHCSTADLARRAGDQVVVVSPDDDAAERLRLKLPQAEITEVDGEIRVVQASELAVGEAAHSANLRLHHLAMATENLEAGYMRLVANDIVYAASAPAPEGDLP